MSGNGSERTIITVFQAWAERDVPIPSGVSRNGDSPLQTLC